MNKLATAELRRVVIAETGSDACPRCGRPMHVCEQRIETARFLSIAAMYDCRTDGCANWMNTHAVTIHREVRGA